jgi:hypothetical protein
MAAIRLLESFLRTQPLSADSVALRQLAWLNIKLTEYLDSIALYAEPGDSTLKALRKLAEDRDTWPMMVRRGPGKDRPGDASFIVEKLDKLGVGQKAELVPPKATLKTAAIRFTRKLINQIRSDVRAVLYVRHQGGDIEEANQQEIQNSLNVLQIIRRGIKEEQQSAYLAILRQAKDCPACKQNSSQWTQILTKFVQLTDPELCHPDLKQPKKRRGNPYVMSPEANNRSKLQQFFAGALNVLLK